MRGVGSHRPLVIIIVVLAALVALTLRSNDPTKVVAVAAIVAVDDPVDGWLGGEGTIEGDIDLATSVLAGEASVTAMSGSLRFEALGASRDIAEERLTAALGAYEVARSDLRAGLDERLEMVPELAAFVERRSTALDREVAILDRRLASPDESATGALRAERAETLSAAVDFRQRGEELADFTGTTLAPIWAEAPIDARLALLDEALSAAFWFAAGERA